SQSYPSFLLEKRGFSLSWGKEVVEGGKDHYPGDFEVCCWGRRGEEVYRFFGRESRGMYSVMKRGGDRGNTYNNFTLLVPVVGKDFH
nr:hypothetical protein [Tanacetum cinerariifolium]